MPRTNTKPAAIPHSSQVMSEWAVNSKCHSRTGRHTHSQEPQLRSESVPVDKVVHVMPLELALGLDTTPNTASGFRSISTVLFMFSAGADSSSNCF